MSGSDWRFLWQPVWIIGHLVAIAAVVGFVAASSWQLTRHQERQDLNVSIETRTSAPTAPLDSITDQPPEAIQFRKVTATGRFDTDAEVLLVLQSLDGVSGHRVLTPLLTPNSADYEAVIVDRGWVPIELNAPRDPTFAPPVGEVTVSGIVRLTQTRGREVPADGILDQIGRVDLDRLQQQIEYDLAPVFVHLESPGPTTTAQLPVLARLPSLDPGRPHLSYAVQWALFATVVIVGYIILLRKTSKVVDDEAEVVSAAA